MTMTRLKALVLALTIGFGMTVAPAIATASGSHAAVILAAATPSAEADVNVGKLLKNIGVKVAQAPENGCPKDKDDPIKNQDCAKLGMKYCNKTPGDGCINWWCKKSCDQ